MRIKPTGAYEDMRIYCVLNVVNLLRVSATFCGHLQGRALRRIYGAFHNVLHDDKHL